MAAHTFSVSAAAADPSVPQLMTTPGHTEAEAPRLLPRSGRVAAKMQLKSNKDARSHAASSLTLIISFDLEACEAPRRRSLSLFLPVQLGADLWA